MEAMQEKFQEFQAQIDTLKNQTADNKLSMIVFSGDLDKVLASFVIATGAVAMGMDVVMFFTFWGMDIITKKKVDHLKVTPVGNTAMHHLFCDLDPAPLSRAPFEPEHALVHQSYDARRSETPTGIEARMAEVAWQSDGILLMNRVKPHTDYKGPIESGLTKICAIGLGKYDGAREIHRHRFALGLGLGLGFGFGLGLGRCRRLSLGCRGHRPGRGHRR